MGALLRCSRQTVTGAAQKAFLVNTPATLLPSASSNNTTSRRFTFLIPAQTAVNLTPLTGCIWGNGYSPTAIIKILKCYCDSHLRRRLAIKFFLLELPMAAFEFFTGTTGARIVTTHFASLANNGSWGGSLLRNRLGQ
jgi:hypothetical protein